MCIPGKPRSHSFGRTPFGGLTVVILHPFFILTVDTPNSKANFVRMHRGGLYN